jgi:hypothetical protein
MFLAIYHLSLRLLVLLLGLGWVYVAVFLIFPWINEKLPLAIALLIFYCIMAYFAIPLLLRVRHLLTQKEHIPMHTLTPDGWPAEPVNIAIIAGNKQELISKMTKAGWHAADKLTPRSLTRALLAIVFNRPYFNAPFSQLYLFGRPFDVGFQIPTGKKQSPRSRHHVRFWHLRIPDRKKHFYDYDYWIEKFEELLGADFSRSDVWIGTAVYDINPLGIQWRDGRLTHKTDMDLDKERDFLINTLKDKDLVEEVSEIKAGEPFSFRGQQFHHKFTVDGNVKMVNLKK